MYSPLRHRGHGGGQTKTLLCTTNGRFLKIFLSKFLVLLSNVFGSFEFWSFEFVSSFEFRASDLVAATPRCDLFVLTPHSESFTIRPHLRKLQIPHFGNTLPKSSEF